MKALIAELRAALVHVRHQTELIEEMHFLAHHGSEHPRVTTRRDRGEGRTPTMEAA